MPSSICPRQWRRSALPLVLFGLAALAAALLSSRGPLSRLERPAGGQEPKLFSSLEEEGTRLIKAALEAREEGRLEEALSHLERVETELSDRGRQDLAAWAAWTAARWAFDSLDLPRAQAAYDRAGRLSRAAGHHQAEIRVHLSHLETLYLSEDLERYERVLGRLEVLLATETQPTLDHVLALWKRGRLEAKRGDSEAAATRFAAAEALAADLMPESSERARVLLSAAELESSRGDQAEAEDLLREALALSRRLEPDSLLTAEILHRQGTVAWRRGDLGLAEALLEEALELEERLGPEGPAHIATLNNLGIVAIERGRLAEAEQRLLAAFEFRQRIAADSVASAYMLANLGEIAALRGDHEGRRNYNLRALAPFERLAPESPIVAGLWQGLGAVARERGELEVAERYFHRASSRLAAVAPDPLRLAALEIELARCELAAGRPEKARARLGGIQAVVRSRAPESLEAADVLTLEAEVAIAEGDPREAARLHGEALGLRTQLAPGSGLEAESAHELGLALERLGDRAAALASLERAARASAHQQGPMGGLQIHRYHLAARFAEIGRDRVRLLVAEGRESEAFDVLEDWRARVFLSHLAERELALPGELPAELLDERRQADFEYDRLLAQGLVTELGGEARREMERKLATLRQRQVHIRSRLKALRPGSAASPGELILDAAASQRALSPGDLLLSYSLGERGGLVFVLGAPGTSLRVVPLPVESRQIAAEVTLYRRLLDEQAPGAVLRPVASRLSDWLLAPVAAELAAARRLTVVPDGPLHVLPFAALPLPGGPGKPKALVEAVALHKVASSTVLAELTGQRSSRPLRLVAFGDPIYPTQRQRSPGWALPRLGVHFRGLRLESLPGTRFEVEALSALFADRARIHLGAEANEANAKLLGKEDSLIHFACHGFVEPRAPLESGLVLSLPENPRAGADNGILQAWEVLEQLRLDAHLVTLSACDSGLGGDFGGEGLLGLTRAFQHAGARSVLPTLWKVEDESTARFMQRFYRELKSGANKVEALRSAQLEMLETGSVSAPSRHPKSWAGFELVGDGG